jgi:hypothetical protein
MSNAASQATLGQTMAMTGMGPMDAETAFARALRSRRRAALVRRLRRAGGGRLAVVDERTLWRSRNVAGGGVREISLCAITGTLEPGRARHFDARFQPAAAVRGRWQRIWLAEHRGAVLPPISVVPYGDGYAVRDGHHRVSVARARGAMTIDATVET